MQRYNERLQTDIVRFHNRVLTDPAGVLDSESVHHEFVAGAHGRKLEFENIETYSDFYIDWVAIYAQAVRALYSDRLPDALVGIASGANRLSRSIAPLLGEKVLSLTTVKVGKGTVRFDEESLEAIERHSVQFAVAVDDVGATGSTTATAIKHLREIGVRRNEVIYGWQRSPTLSYLDELGVPYYAVVFAPLPMFSPQDCATNPEGYCARGIPLIRHGE